MTFKCSMQRKQESLKTEKSSTIDTVKIGNQVWMAKNLDIAVENSWEIPGHPKWGRLYTWDAACEAVKKYNEEHGTHWRLPTGRDFDELCNYCSDKISYRIGLKSEYGWKGDGNGTDAVGFSALPVGLRDYTGEFANAGKGAYFWTSEGGDRAAKRLGLYYINEYSGQGILQSNYGLSVRCVM